MLRLLAASHNIFGSRQVYDAVCRELAVILRYWHEAMDDLKPVSLRWRRDGRSLRHGLPTTSGTPPPRRTGLTRPSDWRTERATNRWPPTSSCARRSKPPTVSTAPCRGSILRTCGGLRLLEDLRGSLVLVDQPAEDRSSPYSALLVEIDDGGRWARRQQVQGPMRPAVVVVLHVLGQDMA